MSKTAVAALLAIVLPACGSSSITYPDAGAGGTGGGDPYAIVTVDAGAPTTLATSAHPWAIAVDGTHVYWTAQMSRTVMKVPRDGGTPTTLASDQERAFTMAVDATHVYWTVDTNPGAVMKVPLEGGTPVTIASGQMHLRGIAVDGESVYWAVAEGLATQEPLGTIMKAPLAGGAPVLLASEQAFPNEIAVDATAVYWTNIGWETLSAPNGSVMKLPLAGGSPVALVSGQVAPREIAIDEEAVYYTVGEGSPSPRGIAKVPLAGGLPTKLASSQYYPIYGLTVDATYVYGARSGSGQHVRVSKLGGQVMGFGLIGVGPVDMALDQTHLYWTDVTGTVNTIAKP